MTERVSPPEGAPACPFLALADDRDARFDHPDRSHRCYAESPPAPRATAHQITFCLGAAFSSCPTFTDWARREVARVKPSEPWRSRGGEERPPARPGGAQPTPASRSAGPAGTPPTAGTSPVGRAPDQRRDWAAPPPWAAESAAAAAAAGAAVGGPSSPGPGTDAVSGTDAVADRAAVAGTVPAASDPSRGAGDAPAFLAGRSRGTLPATGPDEGPPGASRTPSPGREIAGYESRSASAAGRPAAGPASTGSAARGATPTGATPTGSGSAGSAPARPRPSSRQRTTDRGAPAWEEPRRYEAYPAIRTRVGLPRLSPLLLGVAAVAIAAAALFFIPPMFLGLGGGSATPTPTVAPSAEPTLAASPTPTPAPTPTVYIVKSGDTLSKIAASFGLTVEDLLAVNPQITDPNSIQIGDEIVIPEPEPSEIVDTGGEEPAPVP